MASSLAQHIHSVLAGYDISGSTALIYADICERAYWTNAHNEDLTRRYDAALRECHGSREGIDISDELDAMLSSCVFAAVYATRSWCDHLIPT